MTRDVSRRPRRLGAAPSALVILSAGAVTVLTAVATAGATGALSPIVEPGLPDAGDAVRVALPIVQGLRDVLASLTVGLLVVVATCVPGRPPSSGAATEERLRGARSRGAAAAQIAAAGWAASSLALTVLVYADVSGSTPGEAGFWSAAWSFSTGFELGQALLAGCGFAVLIAFGCAVARQVAGIGALAAIAVLGLWPIAQTGHAAGTLSHDDAVTLQMAHLVGIGVWFGGLLALVILARSLGPDLGAAARRWSILAAWSLVLVAVSGVLGAWLRIQQVDGLASGYGAVLAAKVAALVTVALAGLWQRRRLLDRLDAGEPGAFVRVAVLECLVLAAAAGLGVALGRTAPPPPPGAEDRLTAAESMLGRSLPPPLDASRWLIEWDLSTTWLPVALVAVGWYLCAVLRLRRRGDRWAQLRTVSWCLGWILFVWATNGAPGSYGRVLFSMHMVQHMTIATAVPLLLVLGTPVTLALRTTRRRQDGSMGPREWLLRVVHSLPVQLLGHPVVAGASFVVSMVAFYYGPAFETSLGSHTAHLLMIAHFMVSGYLFAEVVVGGDPGVHRPIYPLRALLVMIVFGFHALFAVSLMAQKSVLAEDWFEGLGRTWGATAAQDQYTGASIGWLLGEYPLALMAIALLVSWVRADRRERRRFDRDEDRNGDRALTAYNLALRRLAGQSGSSNPDKTVSSPDRASAPTMSVPTQHTATASKADGDQRPEEVDR